MATTKTSEAKLTKSAVDRILKQAVKNAVAHCERVKAAATIEGRVDRGLAESVLSPIHGSRVTLVTPETGREGIILPNCTSSDIREVASGIGRLPERLDVSIQITGRADGLKVRDGNRDQLASRISERLALAGRPTGDFHDGFIEQRAGDFLRKTPGATEQQLEDFISTMAQFCAKSE